MSNNNNNNNAKPNNNKAIKTTDLLMDRLDYLPLIELPKPNITKWKDQPNERTTNSLPPIQLNYESIHIINGQNCQSSNYKSRIKLISCERTV